jgi:hypothetical protein
VAKISSFYDAISCCPMNLVVTHSTNMFLNPCIRTWCQGSSDDYWSFYKFHPNSSFTYFHVVMMLLGGSYHDRDNPPSTRASHGKTIVLMPLVSTRQTDGRQQSGSSRGVRTSVVVGDEMRMRTMTIFYRGTGTKCTEQKIATRNKDNTMTMAATTMMATTTTTTAAAAAAARATTKLIQLMDVTDP